MAPKLLLINGPNLNLLGTREPHIYGHTTLRDVETLAIAQASDAAASLSVYQSNHEGGIIDRIHAARTEGVAWIIINPGAYTHTSVAIRDALVGVNIPFVEVHVSNVHTREPFRHHSYFSDKAVASVVGLGTYGYTAAVGFCLMKEKEREEKEKEAA